MLTNMVIDPKRSHIYSRRHTAAVGKYRLLCGKQTLGANMHEISPFKRRVEKSHEGIST